MRPLWKEIDRTLLNSADYDVLRHDLIRTVGSFCAYCEAPVTSDVPVEHKVPKSHVAIYATRWINLLPACDSCNIAKSDSPKSKTGGNAREKYYASLDLWHWPDGFPPSISPHDGETDPARAGDDTPALFRYVRDSRSQDTLVAQKLLTARAADTGSATPYPMVWVVPDSGIADANVLDKASLTIRTLGLNRYDLSGAAANDRRVANRTFAWDAARRAALVFTSALPIEDATDAADLCMRGAFLISYARIVRHAVQSLGFWSVWYTVFADATAARAWQRYPMARRALLRRLLVTDENGNAVIPGTDPRRLPNLLKPPADE